MRWLLLALALLAAGCGEKYTAAGPVPSPSPTYPRMLGGWAGTLSDTWVALDGSQPGGRTCAETWLIGSQSGQYFSGVFQRTAGDSDICQRSGTIDGTALPDGTVTFTHANSGVTGGCPGVSGDPNLRGVLSAAGNITAGTVVVIRCPFGRGTIDLRYTTGVSLTRR